MSATAPPSPAMTTAAIPTPAVPTRAVPGDLSARQRVLDAGAARLVAQGYTATTLRQVASDVGIKAGSIYHHFASKEELFRTVFNSGIDVMIRAFEQAHADERSLLNVVRGHLGALFEHGPYTAAHVTAFFTSPESLRASVIPSRDGYESLWNLFLGELLPHLSSKEVALHRLILFGAMNSTIEWFDPSGNLTLDELANVITDQFLQGVAPELDAKGTV